MRSLSYILFPVCHYIIITPGCKKAYAPPAIKVDNRFLVIDGTLVNSIDSPSVFTFSRTTRLTDSTTASSPEEGAQVSVEGSTGEVFNFAEQAGGVYKADHLALNNAAKYRLKIVTASKDQYMSDYVEVEQTRAIDSVSWRQENEVTIYVSAHDPSANTKYYQWNFIETWQYRSEFERTIAQTNGTIYYVNSASQTYNCWSTAYSSGILTGSSAALSGEVISKEPLATIFQNSEKIGIRYSILVKQYAIAQDAYQYLQILKKNTEQLGSIFDAQPTGLTGNIHCTNKPSQIAIGFFTASFVQQKRIFINNNEVANRNVVNTGESCDIVKIPQDPDNFFLYNYPDRSFQPYYFESMPPLIVLTKRSCVDCTLRGGTPQTPSFW